MFNCNVSAPDFLYAGVVFVLINNTFDGSGSFSDSDVSGHLNNARYDVMDWRWILNSGATSIFFKIRPSLSESIMIPEAFILFYEN